MGIKFQNKNGEVVPPPSALAAEEPAQVAEIPTTAGAVTVEDDDLPPFAGSTVVTSPAPKDPDAEPAPDTAGITKAAKKAAKKAPKKLTKKQQAELDAANASADADEQADAVAVAAADDSDPPPFEVLTDNFKVVSPKAELEVEVIHSKVQTTTTAAPEKVELVQPVATVNVKHASGVETQTVEEVGPPIMKTEPMANVGMNMGYTHGLPGYSNIKFGVSLFMPSKTDNASLEETFALVEAFVDGKMQQLRKDLVEGGDEEGGE